MSKFESSGFYGGYDEFAVNAEKYTEEQAIKIFEDETGDKVGDKPGQFEVSKAFVRHRAGISEEGDPVVGWWLEYSSHKRSCPAWVFHRTANSPEGT